MGAGSNRREKPGSSEEPGFSRSGPLSPGGPLLSFPYGSVRAEHLHDWALHRVAPDLVALLTEVELVGHDLLRNTPVGLHEFVADVQVLDRLAPVVELRDVL